MRKSLTLALFLALSACGDFEPAYAYDSIAEDDGGLVDVYALAAQTAEPVRIFGPCHSACTELLAARTVCVSPTAHFMFHAAHNGTDEWGWKYSPTGTAILMRHYSAPLRTWLASQGGLTVHGEIWMTGRQLITLGYKECAR